MGEFLLIILSIGIFCSIGTVASLGTLELIGWIKSKVMSFKERKRK